MNQAGNIAIFLALGLGALSFVFILYSARKSYLLRMLEKHVEGLQQRMDEQAIRLDDLHSKLHNTLTAVSKQSAIVEKRMGRLEEKLAQGANGFKFELEGPEDTKERIKPKEALALETTPKATEESSSKTPESAKKSAPQRVPAKPIAEAFAKTREEFFAAIERLVNQDEVSERGFFDQISKILAKFGLESLANDQLREQIQKIFTEISNGNAEAALTRKSICEPLKQIALTQWKELEHNWKLNRDSESPLQIILLVGAEGTGKTTAGFAMARYLHSRGAKVLFADCDSSETKRPFDLSATSRKLGMPFLAGAKGSKPQATAYRAIHRAQDEKLHFLVLDTSAALDRKGRVSEEVTQVASMISREVPFPAHETLMVLNANDLVAAKQQAENLLKEGTFSGIIGARADQTKAPGAVVELAQSLGLPVWFLNAGAGADFSYRFKVSEFISAICGGDKAASEIAEPDSDTVTSRSVGPL